MQLVTVFTSFNPAEAQLVRSQLDAAGFQASVANELSALSTEGYAMAVGGIKVQVPAEQETDARNLLASNQNPEA